MNIAFYSLLYLCINVFSSAQFQDSTGIFALNQDFPLLLPFKSNKIPFLGSQGGNINNFWLSWQIETSIHEQTFSQ